MASRNVEEYLKAIYSLNQSEGNASTKRLSEVLKVAPASVTQMLKKLSEKGYVDYSPYHGAALTKKGLRTAKKIIRKHRLIERFLYDILGIGKSSVHKPACEMEHSLPDNVEIALCRRLKHPSECPDNGAAIPPCDMPFASCEKCMKGLIGNFDNIEKRDVDLIPLNELKQNQEGKISFIRGDYKVLRRLLDLGVMPGANVKILKSAPLGGPVEISVRGSTLALGRDIASNVFVEISNSEEGK
ncbi:MAG: metal-dependent transcriptional regulator [Candidatus Bathyarchaeia archaeon]